MLGAGRELAQVKAWQRVRCARNAAALLFITGFPAAAQTMTADQVSPYVASICSTIWQSRSVDELRAHWQQLQQGPVNLTTELRRRESALSDAGAARDTMQATLVGLRGQLAMALQGQISAAPVQQTVATARKLTDDERARIEGDLAETRAMRLDLESRRGGQGEPTSDERFLLQMEKHYEQELATPIAQLGTLGQGLRAIAGAAPSETVVVLQDSIAGLTASIVSREAEIALLSNGVTAARKGLNIAKLMLKIVEVNCYQPQEKELAGAGGGPDVQIPQGGVTLLGVWSADCEGYGTAGGFRMIIDGEGGVSGRYTSDIGELPLSGIMNVSGMLAGAAKHPDGTIEWDGYLKRDEALGTSAASGGLVFSGKDFECNGSWHSE